TWAGSRSALGPKTQTTFRMSRWRPGGRWFVCARSSRGRSPSIQPSATRAPASSEPRSSPSNSCPDGREGRHALRGALVLALAAACAAPAEVREPLCRVTHAQATIPFGDAAMEPICDGVYAEPGATGAEIL